MACQTVWAASIESTLLTSDRPLLCFSIVSHGHGALVLSALNALALSMGHAGGQAQVTVTLNVPEPELERQLRQASWPFKLRLVCNALSQGFGANHNQAFLDAQDAMGCAWFVVMNPDIFWPSQAASLWQRLQNQEFPKEVGLLCPNQVDLQGRQQDHARRIMTPWGLLMRVTRRLLGLKPSGVAQSVESADWVNGACMILRSEAFAELGGFDERYFMYCEDTDLCLRLRLAGWIILGIDLDVVHDAQRRTGKSWQHMHWHMMSMLRLWRSKAFWRYLMSERATVTASPF